MGDLQFITIMVMLCLVAAGGYFAYNVCDVKYEKASRRWVFSHHNNWINLSVATVVLNLLMTTIFVTLKGGTVTPGWDGVALFLVIATVGYIHIGVISCFFEEGRNMTLQDITAMNDEIERNEIEREHLKEFIDYCANNRPDQH